MLSVARSREAGRFHANGASVTPKSPVVSQPPVSFGAPSIPVEDAAYSFSGDAVLRPQFGICDFRVLVSEGDNFFVALANLFEGKGEVSHVSVLLY